MAATKCAATRAGRAVRGSRVRRHLCSLGLGRRRALRVRADLDELRRPRALADWLAPAGVWDALVTRGGEAHPDEEADDEQDERADDEDGVASPVPLEDAVHGLVRQRHHHVQHEVHDGAGKHEREVPRAEAHARQEQLHEHDAQQQQVRVEVVEVHRVQVGVVQHAPVQHHDAELEGEGELEEEERGAVQPHPRRRRARATAGAAQRVRAVRHAAKRVVDARERRHAEVDDHAGRADVREEDDEEAVEGEPVRDHGHDRVQEHAQAPQPQQLAARLRGPHRIGDHGGVANVCPPEQRVAGATTLRARGSRSLACRGRHRVRRFREIRTATHTAAARGMYEGQRPGAASQ
mmetsp:Transcript_10731/g.37394  ORF Transcript_10731/g.37394 Transcript_10731/m.37394 type:complete len:350 (-) Transcript_10731:69-1118(-)